MIVVACGDRCWSNYEFVRERLGRLPAGTTVVSGACRGADTDIARAAGELGLPQIIHEADWRQYGRGAGPVRNRLMLAERPDLVLAFHNQIELSKGTIHMVRIAQRAGVPVEVLSDQAETISWER